jgi:predicted heme/steroid binding protein
MKKIFVLTTMFMSIFILSACVSEDDNLDGGNKTSDEIVQMTLEELSMYDGVNGNDAYIAVDGVIYNVTGIAAWSNGTHNGNMAGTDVSDVINSAPHGDSVLDELIVVGELIE